MISLERDGDEETNFIVYFCIKTPYLNSKVRRLYVSYIDFIVYICVRTPDQKSQDFVNYIMQFNYQVLFVPRTRETRI